MARGWEEHRGVVCRWEGAMSGRSSWVGVACGWEKLMGGSGLWVGVAHGWEWLVGGSGSWGEWLMGGVALAVEHYYP